MHALWHCFTFLRIYFCSLLLPVLHCLPLRSLVGGEERSQVVSGDVTAVDLDQLDPGVQYEVQVVALVQNRVGNPVSVRVTTRESLLPVFIILMTLQSSS